METPGRQLLLLRPRHVFPLVRDLIFAAADLSCVGRLSGLVNYQQLKPKARLDLCCHGLQSNLLVIPGKRALLFVFGAFEADVPGDRRSPSVGHVGLGSTGYS